MNTFEKHFRDFPAFIERILAWGPDFLVPVAKKGCKLIKTVEHLPQLRKARDLIKYRTFFELADQPIQRKKVAVVDDATQYGATLQEYRRFFENLGATVRTFSFVGHEDLFSGTRWNEDPLAEIAKPLAEPVYQEYILEQSYHLLKSGHHYDLDHLIFELKLSAEKFDRLLSRLKTHGEVLFVEDYFIQTGTKRFSLNQPLFFGKIPFLQGAPITLGAIRKVKFAYEQKSQTLCFSPLVFPTWDYRHAEVGSAIFRHVPFGLPYKLPDFLDRRNWSALLRTYYNAYFTCVVSFAKAFAQAALAEHNLKEGLTIKRNDLDAVIGAHAAEEFVSSVKDFVCGPDAFDFSGLAPVWRKPKKAKYRIFADVIDDLRTCYQRAVQKSRSRVGVHYYISYDSLFRKCLDPISLSEDLDYYCDLGAIVPEIFRHNGCLLRGCRTGEANADYNWKRTQVLIPLAIDQLRTELNIREKEVEPTLLNKVLANFVFDYPSEANHELHCLVGEPFTYGTLVRAYHRHRAPNKPSIYNSETISPYYEWDPKKRAFRVKDRRRVLKQIATTFDDRQEIPYSEIVTYFRLLARIYLFYFKSTASGRSRNPVDVLNMLSICREENCLYSHLLYNIRTSLEDFGAYVDASGPERLRHLVSSKTNVKSALDKVQLARRLNDTLTEIEARFGRQVEFVKAVDHMKKNQISFSGMFQTTLRQVNQLAVLHLILINLCSLAERQDPQFADELRALECHQVLTGHGISLPESLPAFVRNAEQQRIVINATYDAVIALFDALPREEPMLAARLLNDARQRAKNVATSYVYKAKLVQIALLYVDLSGLRNIPEPKEEVMSRYYQTVEQNLHRRGGKKLYGGSGGDDMFTILFTEALPALQCAKDIKKDFSEDLFLHSSKCDIKFGLSFVVFDGERKEEQIVKCWGNAKDCCEFKGQSFRNRGNLLISQDTLDAFKKLTGVKIERFVQVPNERLKSGSQLFQFVEIAPMPAAE